MIIEGFAERVRVDLKPYKGVDFSRLAFLFGGQGQMVPGLMAEEARTLPLFVTHFKELDELAAKAGCGEPSAFLFAPDRVEKKDLALYSSLCLYTLQVAMFETLTFLGHRPVALTAHSFGEFAQMTSAGVLRFGEMVRFLIERQKALSAVDGGYFMLAVNANDRFQSIAQRFGLVAANFNTLRQTVYVGRSENEEEIKAACKAAKIAAVRVEVDFPFHTHWLNEVKADLRQRMGQLDLTFRAPKIPFVSSVGGEWITKESFSPKKIEELLLNQLTTPVRFPEQIRAMGEIGLGHFIELSPVDVLTPFAEQILQTDGALFKTESFRRLVKAPAQRNRDSGRLKNSKLLDIFNKALKSLSGYTVEDIHLEDRIREDLGIDSIKKAEIVFRMVDSMNSVDMGVSAPVNLAEFATFADVIEYLENSERAKEKMATESIAKSREFELVESAWRECALADWTGDHQLRACTVDLGAVRAGQRTWPDEGDILVLDGRSLQVDDSVLEAAWWLEYFKGKPVTFKRWIFLPGSGVFSSALAAFFRTLAQEAQASFKTIHLDSTTTLDDADLIRESLDFYHNEVRYESGSRLVRDFVRAPAAARKPAPRRVLAFGGLGGVGRHCLLAFEGAPLDVLVIVGRTEPGPVTDVKLQELKSCARAIEYVSVDVTDSGATKSLIAEMEQRLGRFDLILHSVGIEVSDVLPNLSREQIFAILAGKMRLGEVLSDLAANRPELRVVFNSAIVSQFGNVGQCPYSLANQFLNELALRSPNVLSILWPAWDETGMTRHQLIARSLHLLGLPIMTPIAGQKLFAEALHVEHGVRAVLCPDFLPDYLSLSTSRQEFQSLFKFASKSRQLCALSGLTKKNLPYLTHHIVKKLCPFPASGSMALMLFRGYQETGRIGVLRGFSALNFLLIEQESSPYFLKSAFRTPGEMYVQIRSSQLLADGTVDFTIDGRPSVLQHHFAGDRELKIEFDQNVTVYTGPLFRLEQGIFEESATGRMAVRTDLQKAPKYTGIAIVDKIHKLLELAFNAMCLRAIRQHGVMAVPKHVEAVKVFEPALTGSLFYVLVDEVRLETEGPVSDIFVVNAEGQTAIEIPRFRGIIISRKETSEIAEKPATAKLF